MPPETVVPRYVAVASVTLGKVMAVDVKRATGPCRGSDVPTGGGAFEKLKLTLVPPDDVPLGEPILTGVVDEVLLLVLLLLVLVLVLLVAVLVLGEAPPPPPEQAAKARRQTEAVRRTALREVSMILPVVFRVHGNSPVSIPNG